MTSPAPGGGRRAIGGAISLALVPLAGGALVGLSLPPVGVWPLGVVGIALLVSALYGRRLSVRLALGMAAGVGQFFISCAWALQFSIAGYIVLAIVEAAFYAVACALVPPGRGRFPAAVGALALAEWARQTWPFGGLPLGGIALGQANGPLAPTARLGGSLLVAGVTVLAGTSLAALCTPVLTRWTRRRRAAEGASSRRDGRAAEGASSRRDGRAAEGASSRRDGRAAEGPSSRRDGRAAEGASSRRDGRATGAFGGVVGIVVVVGLVVGGRAFPPSFTGAGSVHGRTIRIAVVQGGGRRGLSQLQVPASVVFRAALRETARVPRGTTLIVWPEDVVALNRALAGSADEAILASVARRHHATLVAGVTEPVGTSRFRNEIVAFAPSGRLVAEFEKVHRVPFGEYVPWRGFFSHFASLKDVPRDAVPGRGTGMIATPAGRFAMLVSYEVFFPDRGRSGVRAGGEVVLVPTNTSSYSNDQAPAQEIAASRLQALEEGRYVLQAAPTGYSAVIDPAGDVLAQTALSRPALLVASVPLLHGSDLFLKAGNLPVLLAAVLALCAGWVAALTRRERRHRHRRRSPSR